MYEITFTFDNNHEALAEILAQLGVNSNKDICAKNFFNDDIDLATVCDLLVKGTKTTYQIIESETGYQSISFTRERDIHFIIVTNREVVSSTLYYTCGWSYQVLELISAIAKHFDPYVVQHILKQYMKNMEEDL